MQCEIVNSFCRLYLLSNLYICTWGATMLTLTMDKRDGGLLFCFDYIFLFFGCKYLHIFLASMEYHS